MSSELELIWKRLTDEGGKTAAYLQGLDPKDWERQVYTTGSGWGVRQVLAHFISAEANLLRVIRDVVAGGPGAPRDLDIDEFNEGDVPRVDQADIASLIEQFRTVRTETASLVRRMAPADLESQGYHPWFGVTEVRNMLKLIYRHNMIHLRDVRRALESGAPVPHVESTPPAMAAGTEQPS